MKILMIHNKYAVPGRGSGEEVMIEAIQRLLEGYGHTVIPFIRSSLEKGWSLKEKVGAFFSGIYSFRSKKEIKELIHKEHPDLVFVQNLYPLISPSVLGVFKNLQIPVIMRTPNYRLVCPNGLFLSHGAVCERCSGGREYWCMLRNCEEDIFKSIGYALRNYVARRFSLFKNNVDIFMALTEFSKNKLVDNGYDPERVHILSGLAEEERAVSAHDDVDVIGDYIGFVGRMSLEKGLDIIIEAAKMIPEIPFKIAGKIDRKNPLIINAPSNVEFLGALYGDALDRFYREARLIVVPSKWYEGLPVVIIEAMLRKKPVICSEIGGLPEIVEEGITGILFKPGNVNDFIEKVEKLWGDTDLCRRLGVAGWEKAKRTYSADAFYTRFMNAFEKAKALKGNKRV